MAWATLLHPRQLLRDSIDSARAAGLPPRLAVVTVLGPWVVTFLVTVVLTIPATRDAAKEQFVENSPVELATAALLFVGSIGAWRLLRRARRADAPTRVIVVLGLAAVGMLLVALEEVAWGQWLFDFDTPGAIAEINEQDELTVHNLRGINGRTEFLRLAFGVVGAASVLLSDTRMLRGIAPPAWLLGWFLLIAGLAIPDLAYDFIDLTANVGGLFDNLSELNELWVAIAAVLYLWSHRNVGDAPTGTEMQAELAVNGS